MMMDFKPIREMEIGISQEELQAIKRLWDKFHTETDCGKDGQHWVECDRIAEMFGAQ